MAERRPSTPLTPQSRKFLEELLEQCLRADTACNLSMIELLRQTLDGKPISDGQNQDIKPPESPPQASHEKPPQSRDDRNDAEP